MLCTLFYVLGLTFGLILDGEDINIEKRHDVGFEIHLQPQTIRYELISFCIHDFDLSVG
jgi:hypothetical protein